MGHNEAAYLDPLDAIVEVGTTADRLLALYEGAWRGELGPVFEAATYDSGARAELTAATRAPQA